MLRSWRSDYVQSLHHLHWMHMGKRSFWTSHALLLARSVHFPAYSWGQGWKWVCRACAGRVQGMCSCSPKYEGQHFWGFVELLIIRDLQTAEQCFASHSCQCHLGGSEKAEGVTCKSLGSVETWYCCEFFAYSHYLQEFNCMDSMALKCWIVMVHHPWCRTVVCWSVLVRLVITKL